MRRRLISLVFCSCLSFTLWGSVKPGSWNENFTDSLAYAESKGVPLVVVWGRTNCSSCKKLHAVLEDDVIMDWAEDHPIMMVSKYGSSKCTDQDFLAAKSWIRSIDPNIVQLPFVAVYWKKTDGSVVCKTAFTGVVGDMPASEPEDDLAGQFVGSLDLLVGDYEPGVLTGDVSFVTADTQYDRLEAEADTITVYVPLKRTSGEKAVVNGLKAEYPSSLVQSVSVSWQIGVTNLTVPVKIASSAFQAGQNITLTLTDANGTTLDTSSIAMVNETENGLTNPDWIGEGVSVGEWTMDLDAAKRKTAATSGDAYTFVMFTGALWCPWCQGFENGVLGTSTFTTWAKENGINLVELDNPRRAEDPTEGPTGAPPTLLRYAAGLNSVIGKSVSGASYLSRKGIATADAEAVLLRNHELGYNGPDEGGYCAPEAARSGYPTIVLLRKDGSVAGRFNAYAPTNTGYDLDENMQRFEDFLFLTEEGDYLASWQTTTTRTLGLDEVEAAPFQINDTTEWFKLEGPFDAYITVACAAERDVTLTITDADGNTLGQPAKNMLTISRPMTDVLYLKATCYEDADKTEYAAESTRFTAAFTLTTSEEEPEKNAAFKSLSKSEQRALNPALYAKRSATVPIYESVNFGGKQLVGTLAVSVTSANKISAKFTGAKTVSFSGTWDEINLGSGEVTTTLAKTASRVAYTLNLAMDAEGGFEAMISAAGETLGSGSAAAGDISAYGGNYTVTLVDSANVVGTGYLTMKITNAGKATVKGIMPDGTSISVSAVLSPNADGTATLPVCKYSNKYTLSVSLAIKPDAYMTWNEREMAKDCVSCLPTCLATWTASDVIAFDIYGGYWESTSPLAICDNYELSEDLAVVIGGETNDFVTATKSGFKVTKDVITSLTFAKSTGAFSGKARICVDSLGKAVNATVKGVLLPGWIDCGCTADPIVERPYGSGTLYYKVGKETFSVSVDLVAKPAK